MPTLRGAPFIPTTSRSGNESQAIFRAKNMLLRGKRADRLYLEVYAGSFPMEEEIAAEVLTGTVTYVGGPTRAMDGTGTFFKLQLHPGQILLINNEFVVVNEILDDTHATLVAEPINTFTGATGYQSPVLFELNERRGTLRWGNALEFDKGTIIGVGSGTLRVNGVPLVSSFLALSTPRIAVKIVGTDNSFNIYDLGMATPVAPTLAAVAGGTKNMQPGLYSIRIAPARTATGGFNNPSAKVEVTIAANQRIEITFPAMDTATGQDSWRIYGTLYTANQGINGPWFFVQVVTSTQLGGTGAGTTFNVEWLDGEIVRNDLLEFDNFAPPEAEFVASLGGNPVYISCFGRTGGRPGPNIVPVKPRNIEAALVNLNLRLDPAHTIVGWQTAQGRLFLMTNNSLQIGTLSNLAFAPITTRPFWKRGFHNPYSLVFVNGRLWGWTHNGPTRSAVDGEEGSEEFEFGADVREITGTWNDGKVFVAHDPSNEAVCFVHSAHRLNSAGFWTSLILPYSLPHEMWMPPIELSSDTGDMAVSGVATVKNRLFFLAGGRQQVGDPEFDAYEFDRVNPSGPPVPYFAAWQYSDGGAEDRAKRIGAFRVTGRFQSAQFAIYSEDEDGKIQDEPFEDPAQSLSGDIPIWTGAFDGDSAAPLKRREREELNLREPNLWTARISGEWDPTGVNSPRDRIDEINVEVTLRKMRR